ncbi:MAG: DMT family transporter [Clostridia bacterium]|nr:DMT family transporter [Clostridia bacterium]
MTTEKKAMLAACVAFSIFGLSYLFSKTAMEVAEPMILLCVRFSVTFILLNLLVLFRVMKLNLKNKNLLGLILLGIIQPVLYFVFENYGLKYTTTSFTGLISSISPIFTALLGVVMLREKPNLKQWVGIGLSITGVMMVSLGSTGGVNTPIGCLCLLLAYLMGALYNVLVRKLSKEFSAFEITYVMFTVGVAFFAVLAFVTHGSQTVPMITTALGSGKFIVSCLYLGGAASVGAYMLGNYALGHLPVTRASVFNSFATIVSILSGVIIMRDPFTWVSALAFALILLGVWSVNYFAEKEPA